MLADIEFTGEKIRSGAARPVVIIAAFLFARRQLFDRDALYAIGVNVRGLANKLLTPV